MIDVLFLDHSEITPDSGFFACDQVLVGALKGSLGRDCVPLTSSNSDPV